jgi:hypothetical protein
MWLFGRFLGGGRLGLGCLGRRGLRCRRCRAMQRGIGFLGLSGWFVGGLC